MRKLRVCQSSHVCGNGSVDSSRLGLVGYGSAGKEARVWV
jgi:hypothetical protein